MRLSSISTHDLTRRSTTTAIFYFKTLSISTHDLTRRSTQYFSDASFYVNISTHDLTRRSTDTFPNIIATIYISTHDLTRRSTLLQVLLQTSHSHFNSRPHKEVDASAMSFADSVGNFNSRPHKEVDEVTLLDISPLTISTHDLTRRSTAIFTQKVFLSKSLFVLIAYNTFILY